MSTPTDLAARLDEMERMLTDIARFESGITVTPGEALQYQRDHERLVSELKRHAPLLISLARAGAKMRREEAASYERNGCPDCLPPEDICKFHLAAAEWDAAARMEERA